MSSPKPTATTVQITIDANGNAPNTNVNRGDQVYWTLTSTATQSYSVNPPNNMFQNNDNPACFTLSAGASSGTYTVKQSATVGGHSYVINAGPCGGAQPFAPRTGSQMITVDS